MVRGRGGGAEKIILFMFYWGGGGNEDFVDIFFLGGGVSNWTSFRGHFYAILGPFLSSLYRIQNGDVLGVAKISVLFIYLFIFKLKMRQGWYVIS